MALAFIEGDITSSASEQTLFDVSADEYFATWIFCHNMTGADVITVKVYVKDEHASSPTTVLRVYESKSIAAADVSAAPAVFIPPVPTKEYKVTIQRTAGSDRVYTWMRMEQP